jgi:hypothetical protein
MANTNFIVQNGLTVGPLQIFAGNGDIISTGNLTVAGLTANSTQENISAQSVTIKGVQAATVSDAQAFAIALS